MEGAEEVEVSELALEEVEILELLSEEESGKALEWRESATVLETTGTAPELEELQGPKIAFGRGWRSSPDSSGTQEFSS